MHSFTKRDTVLVFKGAHPSKSSSKKTRDHSACTYSMSGGKTSISAGLVTPITSPHLAHLTLAPSKELAPVSSRSGADPRLLLFTDTLLIEDAMDPFADLHSCTTKVTSMVDKVGFQV